jgi:hypothetical protein
MAEIKLGRKIQCSECETRFYDLGKPQTACPKCGKVYIDAGETPIKPPVAGSRSRLQKVDTDRGGGDDDDDDDDDDLNIGGGDDDDDDDDDVDIDDDDLPEDLGDDDDDDDDDLDDDD